MSGGGRVGKKFFKQFTVGERTTSWYSRVCRYGKKFCFLRINKVRIINFQFLRRVHFRKGESPLGDFCNDRLKKFVKTDAK